MSFQAVAWALNQSPTYDPTTRLILVVMAETADDEGRNVWQSHQTIAEKACVSVSTVKRRLREMVAEGLIRDGDQTLVERFPANRRPNVYDLAMHLRRGAVVPDSVPLDVVSNSEPDTRGVNLTPQNLGGQQTLFGGSNDDLGGSESKVRGVSDDLQTTLEPPYRTTLEPLALADANAQQPDGRSAANQSTPEGFVADRLHTLTKGALNFKAMRPIAKWALDNHPGLSPNDLGRTMFTMYQQNRGISRQSLGVVLQGFVAPEGRVNRAEQRRNESQQFIQRAAEQEGAATDINRMIEGSKS